MALDKTRSHTRGLDPAEGYSRNRRYVQDARDCTVGPMPVQTFLNAFLPSVPVDKEKEVLSSKGAFKEVPSSGSKPSDIYEPLLVALNRSAKLRSCAPGLVFENTSINSAEPHTPGFMKPHICCYTRRNLDSVHDTPASSRAELGYVELFIEVKPDVALDFFVDPSPETTREDCDTHDFFTRFQNEELKLRAERVFGQHITYAMEIQARQHRVCLFSISMSGSRARILRWDRSGIIITQSFDILTHPELLSEFLARFAFASDHQRGHDMSIGMATQKEEVLFCDVVTKYIKDQLDLVDDALTDAVAKHYQQGCVFAVRMFVDDSSATPSSSTPVADRYLVFRPITSPLRLLGRATCASAICHLLGGLLWSK
ncbi:hypothetical protein TRAPUB_2279 [Trametes pubescens]|uniref:Fungal-type protein kinase domain-containing protein n=1 Tax=Trametes pubescens TaxID=154538 RepID=A0A1M2VH68_TRAPU|nr:hypothetical protein TRAPUB_2279 [Trametes pubescens]